MSLHPDRPRPAFFADPASDRIVAIVTALGAEVAALIGRLDTIETLAGRKGVLTREEIEAFEPTAEDAARRDALQRSFVERVFAIMRQEADDLRARTTGA